MLRRPSRIPDRCWIGAACALVFLAYFRIAAVAQWPAGLKSEYYPLLTDGFRAGQLHLPAAAPEGLVNLPDPYDPNANAAFRVWNGWHDVTYYRGKLYLYFGPAPVLVLLLPWKIVFGDALNQGWTVAFFCALGFSALAWIFLDVRRKFFSESRAWLAALCVLGLGIATGPLMLLWRPEVYEVALSCGYALTMVALAGLWRTLVAREPGVRWLALASFAYGLAVAARPSLLFGAVGLLIPAVGGWRVAKTSMRRIAWLAAAGMPLAVVVAGLLLYNQARFGNPLEFGQRFQIGGNFLVRRPHVFVPDFFWLNFRLYFLAPMQWVARFPFAAGVTLPGRLPPDYFGAENPFGVLANLPVLWFAAAVPLAWRVRPPAERDALRSFAVAALAMFGACAVTLCFFAGVCGRYEVEFTPAFALLSMVGILALERAQPRATIVRAGAAVLLLCSMAFAVFVNFGAKGGYASLQNNIGYAYLDTNRVPEALERFRAAVRFNPGFVEAQCNWGAALFQVGRLPEAAEHFAAAVRLEPGSVDARNSLAFVCLKLGRAAEAKAQFREVLRLQPDFPGARENLQRAEVLLGGGGAQAERAR